MCELLAISTKKQHPVNGVLETFYKRSEYHPHGWGLALYSNDNNILQKEPIKAVKSDFLKRQLRRNLKANVLLAHVRFATVGLITPDNCHPFQAKDITGRNWTLIHNGTLFKERIPSKYKFIQKGDTDSERLLLYLVDKINKKITKLGRDLSEKERFQIVNEEIVRLSEGCKLNILIYNDDTIYGHSNCKDQLYYSKFEDGLVISTTKLDIDRSESEWEPFPFRQVIAVKDGEILFRGEPNSSEYIEDPETNRLLYLKYANL